MSVEAVGQKHSLGMPCFHFNTYKCKADTAIALDSRPGSLVLQPTPIADAIPEVLDSEC